MHIFEGKYNNYLTINISAVNCAGHSEGVVVDVYEGITKLFSYSYFQPGKSYIRGERTIYTVASKNAIINLLQLAALLLLFLTMEVCLTSPVPELELASPTSVTLVWSWWEGV